MFFHVIDTEAQKCSATSSPNIFSPSSPGKSQDTISQPAIETMSDLTEIPQSADYVYSTDKQEESNACLPPSIEEVSSIYPHPNQNMLQLCIVTCV